VLSTACRKIGLSSLGRSGAGGGGRSNIIIYKDDVLHSQGELILVMFARSTVFRAAVREHTQKRNFFFFYER
jgi:hypothetical protein